MSIDKIGSINKTLQTDPRAAPTRRRPVPEKTEDISISKTGEIKNVTKTYDPPFFPICVTQSMFKVER